MALAILFLGILVSINGCRTIQNDCLYFTQGLLAEAGPGTWKKSLEVTYTDSGHKAKHFMALIEVGNHVWAGDHNGSFDTGLPKTVSPGAFGFVVFLKAGYLRSGTIKIIDSKFAEDN